MKKRLELLIPLIVIAVSLAAELLLSNFVYFSFVLGKGESSNYPALTQPITVSEEANQIFSGGFDLPINSVSLRLRYCDDFSEQTFVDVSVYTMNDAAAEQYSLAIRKKLAVTDRMTEHTLFFNTAGNATDIAVDFGDFSGEIEVGSLTVNPDYKMSFNYVRFGLMMLLGALIYFYKLRGENPNLSYETRHKRSQTASVLVCAGCVILVTALNLSGEGLRAIEYPLLYDIGSYDPYIQQFDAFMKGQLHLDVVPDERLLALENPYSPAQREGIYYLWDRAFFDGKYFSYFGIAPILTVYYPFYLLTGMLPSASFVMTVFGIMTALFFALALEEYARISGKKNFGYFPAFCAVSAFLSSFALLIFRGQARFYYIASMAGMAFSAAFLFFMLRAVGSKKTANRLLSFALAGVSFGLGFLSRVNSVLPLAVVSAVFVVLWAVKRIREKKFPMLLGEASALGLPVAAALAASMVYNKLRFGGFFDFGTDYQLTVSDTSLYSVGLFGLVPSFFHYFLQNLGFTAEFPFVGFDYVAASDYGRYVYVDSGLGIFATPFMLVLLLSPVVFKKKSVSRNKKLLFGAALLSLPLTAFLNFCLGGVIFRYTADLSLLAAFLAGATALEAADSVLEGFGVKGYKLFRNALFVLGIANIAVAAGMALMESGNLVSASPVLQEQIKDIFVFSN